MRLLRINGYNVDIDEKTAIGITFQAYDIKEPGKRKTKLSNSFTIPLTSTNQRILGFAGNVQSIGTEIYDSMLCDYWIDNEQLISNAKVRIEEISDRAKLFVYEKEDLWDLMKLFSWSDFVGEFIEWMQDEKGLPSATNPNINNLGVFLNPYINSTEGLILPFYFGNLALYEPAGEGTGFLETLDTIWLKYYTDTDLTPSKGGHFCAYVKTIFEFIEYKYEVDFLTNTADIIGNIWDDAYVPLLYTPMRDIDIRFHYTGSTLDGFYFEKAQSGIFAPEEDLLDKGDKTLGDFVNSFFQHFNVIKDEFEIEGVKVIRLARFDDIETLAEVIDFSGKIDLTKIKFKPKIEGYSQQNTIRFSDIFPEGDESLNQKVLNCSNKNLDPTSELFTIDAYVPNYIAITGGVVPNLAIADSFKTFEFFISDGVSADVINIKISDNTASEQTATFILQKPSIYSLTGEYNFLDDIITYPKFYEIEKWLTIKDIKDLQFFRQNYIRELNGSFFINKISGFNPDKSNAPTKLELIRISDKVPKPIDQYAVDFWADGDEDVFVDGNGDYFI